MKKIIMASLLVFVPFMSMAADHCTNPDIYFFDKRCYVTDEQKRTSPYNAVVALVGGSGAPYCTGTILNFGGRLVVHTAKHCVVDDAGTLRDKITVMTQTGKKISVKLKDWGSYDVVNSPLDRSDDWAYYTISSADGDGIPWASLTDPDRLHERNAARVVGYGGLKIMSDGEIKQFKQKYKDYLWAEEGIDSNSIEAQYCFSDGGGVCVWSTYGYAFWEYLYNNERAYYNDIFRNKRLKVSKCVFTLDGEAVGCQIWGGNSGGGVFDSDGGLMGVLTGYSGIIGGGWNHSSAAGRGSGIKNVTFFK